jgi:hypothetical protein
VASYYSYERGNESFVFIRRGEYFDYLRENRLFSNASDPWSCKLNGWKYLTKRSLNSWLKIKYWIRKNTKLVYSVKFNHVLSSTTWKISWFLSFPAPDVLTKNSFSSPLLLQKNTGLVSSTSSASTRPAKPLSNLQNLGRSHYVLITESKTRYFLPNHRNLTGLPRSLLAFSSAISCFYFLFWDRIQIISAPLWKRFCSYLFYLHSLEKVIRFRII